MKTLRGKAMLVAVVTAGVSAVMSAGIGTATAASHERQADDAVEWTSEGGYVVPSIASLKTIVGAIEAEARNDVVVRSALSLACAYLDAEIGRARIGSAVYGAMTDALMIFGFNPDQTLTAIACWRILSEMGREQRRTCAIGVAVDHVKAAAIRIAEIGMMETRAVNDRVQLWCSGIMQGITQSKLGDALKRAVLNGVANAVGIIADADICRERRLAIARRLGAERDLTIQRVLDEQRREIQAQNEELREQTIHGLTGQAQVQTPKLDQTTINKRIFEVAWPGAYDAYETLRANKREPSGKGRDVELYSELNKAFRDEALVAGIGGIDAKRSITKRLIAAQSRPARGRAAGRRGRIQTFDDKSDVTTPTVEADIVVARIPAESPAQRLKKALTVERSYQGEDCTVFDIEKQPHEAILSFMLATGVIEPSRVVDEYANALQQQIGDYESQADARGKRAKIIGDMEANYIAHRGASPEGSAGKDSMNRIKEILTHIANYWRHTLAPLQRKNMTEPVDVKVWLNAQRAADARAFRAAERNRWKDLLGSVDEEPPLICCEDVPGSVPVVLQRVTLEHTAEDIGMLIFAEVAKPVAYPVTYPTDTLEYGKLPRKQWWLTEPEDSEPRDE
ncbi:MAG: hypothetical protein LBJ42_00110 [Holosporales bacterium]|jgi:hypothetical protein|nr:hypothetical protein [Holosporales bacterium]